MDSLPSSVLLMLDPQRGSWILFISFVFETRTTLPPLKAVSYEGAASCPSSHPFSSGVLSVTQRFALSLANGSHWLPIFAAVALTTTFSTIL